MCNTKLSLQGACNLKTRRNIKKKPELQSSALSDKYNLICNSHTFKLWISFALLPVLSATHSIWHLERLRHSSTEDQTLQRVSEWFGKGKTQLFSESGKAMYWKWCVVPTVKINYWMQAIEPKFQAGSDPWWPNSANGAWADPLSVRTWWDDNCANACK